LPVGGCYTLLPWFGTKVPAAGEGLSEPSVETDGNSKKQAVTRPIFPGYFPKDLCYRWLQPTAGDTAYLQGA